MNCTMAINFVHEGSGRKSHTAEINSQFFSSIVLVHKPAESPGLFSKAQVWGEDFCNVDGLHNELMLVKLMKQTVDAVLLPLGGAMLALDGGKAKDEAAVIDDARIGFFEGGAKVDDFRRFDVHHPEVKCARRAEEIGTYAVIRHIQKEIQNRICIHLAVPDATDDFRIRSDLGELVNEFAGCHTIRTVLMGLRNVTGSIPLSLKTGLRSMYSSSGSALWLYLANTTR